MRHNHGRDLSRQARGEQFSTEEREIVSGHVDDKRGIVASHFLPIRLVIGSRLGRAMAADNDHPGAFAAVRERDTQCGRRGRACSNPGHDVKRHAGLLECIDFFGESSENRGIPAMKANDVQTSARRRNHSLVDFCLGDALSATTLAYVLHSGRRSGQGQDRSRDEVIVKHQIGFAQQVLRSDRQKLGIARPGPDQADSLCALLHNRTDFSLRGPFLVVKACLAPCMYPPRDRLRLTS